MDFLLGLDRSRPHGLLGYTSVLLFCGSAGAALHDSLFLSQQAFVHHCGGGGRGLC